MRKSLFEGQVSEKSNIAHMHLNSKAEMGPISGVMNALVPPSPERNEATMLQEVEQASSDQKMISDFV